jgi:hypothetical protein
MPRVLKKRRRVGDDVVGWVGILATTAALYVFHNPSEPHKWHPAIVWTCTAFSCIALFGRTRWRSWKFWLLWVFFLLVHILAMWWIFGRLLPAGHVWGTIYVIPIGFVEGILVLGLLVRIERMFD